MPFHNIKSFPILHFEELHSTNSYLSDLCNEKTIDEMTTVITDFQTAGRGQRGNSWESEAGCNLLYSVVLYPCFLTARHQFVVSQIVAIAIQEVLSQYADGFSIKWPNDIYWREKKIAGILIENDLCGTHIERSIIGIGLNVNQSLFVSSAPNPISLFQIIGSQVDRGQLLDEVLKKISHYYNDIQTNSTYDIKQKYMNVLFRKEGLHPYRDSQGVFNAQIADIEESGRIILKDDKNQARAYYFKEVEYIL